MFIHFYIFSLPRRRESYERQFVDYDESMYDEAEPLNQFEEEVPMYESDDPQSILDVEPVAKRKRLPKPKPTPKPIAFVDRRRPTFEADCELDDELDLPLVSLSLIVEPEREQSVSVPIKESDEHHLPRNVLRHLDQFITKSSDPAPQHGSQAAFVMKNQLNRYIETIFDFIYLSCGERGGWYESANLNLIFEQLLRSVNLHEILV